MTLIGALVALCLVPLVVPLAPVALPAWLVWRLRRRERDGTA
jgi:hypothetical protein